MIHISIKVGRFLSILILLLSITINGFSNSNSISAQNDSLEVFNLIKASESDDISFETALQYAHKARVVALQSDCNSCITDSYYAIIDVFYNNSMYDSALFYAQLGAVIADTFGLVNKEADFNLTMGLCYGNMGLTKKSIDALVNVLTVYEDVNDSVGISFVLVNLSSILVNDNNFADALEYINRALIIFENTNDKTGESICLNNIGDIYLSTFEYEKALVYFRRSLEIDKELGDVEGSAICLFNIGECYNGLGDTTLSISFYTKSLEIGKANNLAIIGVTYEKLGYIYLSKANLDMAYTYAVESVKVAETENDAFDLLSSYALLQKCYAALGNFKKAYLYSEMHNRLYDSTYTIAKSKNIQEVISQYNDNKQKTEIISLKEESTIASKYRTHLIRTIFAISIFLIVLFIAIFFTRRAKIREKRQKLYYEKLLERSEDFIFVVGNDGLSKYISPSYHRKIGREIEDRTGKDSFEFIHPDDIENVKKEFTDLATDGNPRTIEFRIMNTLGEWIDVNAYGQNLFDDPMIQGIIVNFWDITQRKNNEMLIKKNETKFRQIFNSFPDIYFESDLDGMVTEISPSVEKIAGYTRNEIIGTNSKEYYRYIGSWEKIQALFDSNSFINDFDTKIITKSGNSINCSFSAEIVLSDEDTPVGVKGVIRDISSRIAGQEKLRKSEQMLKEANKSKELLFSIISHDLIGPIGTNKSIVDLIVSQIDEFSHEEIVSLITSLKPSLDSTFSLIENLLSWARIQQDRISPTFEKISLNKMIREMVMLLLGQANRKSISLNIVGTKPITVYADKNQLDVMLRNLVSNAIKFSKIKGQVSISIDIIDDMAEVKISDSGIGMNKNQIDEILGDRGSTNVRRGTDNEKGTGFGLIIVNEFIKNNKGKLSVHSNVGEGTTFVVKLPLFK